MTRIASGVTDQGFYFVAVDATDFTTREPGLSTWTVYRERNNGATTAMTTPTITEADATNMPGVYFLLCDEDTTIDSGDVEQEQVYHITHSGMAPVTHAVTLFRPTVTAGNTLDVTSGGEAGLDFNNVNLPAGSIPSLGWIDNGTGQAGATSSTFLLRAAASFADDLILGATIVLTGGTGAGQARVISDYVSATDTATVSPNWTTTPDNTTTYFVYPTAPAATAASALPAVNLTHVAGSSTDVSALATNVAAILVDTGTTLDARIPAALVGGRMDATVDGTGMESGAVNAILDAALADSVPADGALPTVRQAIYMVTQFLTERSVSGTTLTIRKVDGSTALMTFTLSDATSPVSVTRAT